MEAITLAELLRVLEDASRGCAGEGFTVAELLELRPMGAQKAREIVRVAIRKGIVRPSRKRVADIAGRQQIVPSYVFVKRRRGKA